MRVASLRGVSFGLFSALSSVLFGAWVVSWFSVGSTVSHPDDETELAAGFIRGRAAFHYRFAYRQTTPGYHFAWLGKPEKQSDVLGTFYFEHFDGPELGHPRLAYVGIEVAIPPLVIAAGFLAYWIRRRFQVTFTALLSMFVVACVFLALYANSMPKTRKEVHFKAPTEANP
jgi:hypothetical protein